MSSSSRRAAGVRSACARKIEAVFVVTRGMAGGEVGVFSGSVIFTSYILNIFQLSARLYFNME
jgi:hypothetical protein